MYSVRLAPVIEYAKSKGETLNLIDIHYGCLY